MNLPITIPSIALKAWPSLADATFIERVTAPVPADPDTIYDIYKTKSGQLLTFVRIDFPDPQYDELDFHRINHRYRLGDLLKPYDETTIIPVQEHDDMDGDFLIPDKNATSYDIYYYVAKTTIFGTERLISANLLAIADALVTAGNLDDLNALHDTLASIIYLDMPDEDIEVIPNINEYVGDAIDLIQQGKAAVDAKALSARIFLRRDD